MLLDMVSQEETDLSVIQSLFRHLERYRVPLGTQRPHPCVQSPSAKPLALTLPDRMACSVFVPALNWVPGTRLSLYAEALGALWAWESQLFGREGDRLWVSIPQRVYQARQRKHYRVRLSLLEDREITLRVPRSQEPLVGEILDISEGGIRIRLSREILSGQVVDGGFLGLQFFLRDQGAFRLRGEVQHSIQAAGGQFLGVRFMGLSHTDQSRIAKYVRLRDLEQCRALG